MWKQVKAILQWIRLLIGSQWRSKSKEVVRADLGALQMRRAEQLITLSNYEEPGESQRGEHCKNQARREERKRELLWLHHKDAVGLNRTA